MSAILVTLSDRYRLSSEGVNILLEEKSSDGWLVKFRYASLGDALQGYIRYSLSVLGQTAINCGVLDLLDAVQKLDGTVGEAYNELMKKACVQDPIEHACLYPAEEVDGTE